MFQAILYTAVYIPKYKIQNCNLIMLNTDNTFLSNLCASPEL